MKRRTFIAALGGAAVWPLVARGQQPAMPVIGFLRSRSAGDFVSAVAAFRAGLAETGYVEGRNAAIGLLVNQNSTQGQGQARDVQEAAQKLGLQLVVLNGGSDEDIDAAFASLARLKVGALLVGADPSFDPRRNRLIAMVAQRAVPAIYQFRDYALAGGLMSYGASIAELYQQVGIYVGRVLNGDKPGDMPVMLPAKFEMVINLKTAKALGFDIPPQLLAQADEVIE